MECGEGRRWEEGRVCEGVEEGAPEIVEVEVRGIGRLLGGGREVWVRGCAGWKSSVNKECVAKT